MRRRIGYAPGLIAWTFVLLLWVAAIYLFALAAVCVAAVMFVIWVAQKIYHRTRPAPVIYEPKHPVQR